ncbi:non-ribosomal peptide synthetase [Peristeroidobacter soli]|uniref:non-ribosomal peptide synthetase n=1 Tax=Peristeroidobacter soli TaxID=2497877 RepID=UPI00158A3AB4|nr:non-ribosomal peptide synthetase [Peristeroidobacter soli]
MTNSSGAASKRANLSPEQAKLLELMLEKRTAKSRIRPQPREQVGNVTRAPASWAQQRLWFFDQLQGSSAAYNIPLSLRLAGALDEPALRRALDAIVQRHEVLRTSFVSVSGEAHQEIATSVAFELRLIDLTGHPESQRESRVQQHRRDEMHTPFDLRQRPLIRGRLLRLQPQSHVLLITMHHIVSDGWSTNVLIRELTQLYSAFASGAEATLEPLPIQYADYAQWQRQWLRGEVLDQQMHYWRTALEGAASQVDLPTDRPRPAIQDHRGQSVPLIVDEALSARLRALAQRHGMTLFMALHAAWALLLSRLSGQEDIVVGTPVANRRRAEVEGLIGFFINMLPLRVSVPAGLELDAFLKQVKQATLGAYDHQDTPFERLVEELKPERTLSRHPIFQTVFVLQNAPRDELRLHGLEVTQDATENDAAKFDLQLVLEERGTSIGGALSYAEALFDRRTVERWSACYLTLLNSMTEAAHAPIGTLELLPRSEYHLVVETFNDTGMPYPREKLLHQLFEEHARRTPGALALTYRGVALSYAELNSRANRLARFLRTLGIGPDRLVGLCVERGIELMVGVLGVLKAGGAYVPLDPHYPTDRLAYMLNDAAPSVLLTNERLKGGLPETPARVVALDADWHEICAHQDADLDAAEIGVGPNHLANVIYTSGSTGRPKGVMVPHRGICNLAVTQLGPLEVRADSRFLQFASVSFDAFTWEWTSSYSAGACLCLADRDELAAGEPLRATLQSQGITHAILSPIVLAAMPGTEGLASFRSILAGGDVCTESLVQRWAPGRRFLNGYGPTEISVCASVHVCAADEAGNPPIGRPIANSRIYILDAYHQPVPVGVCGEIYIAGAGVTRGYHNRPALTAERFVADRFGTDARVRMYRTGDLGRWRPDGSVEYLGRNDHQVKIRGVRIELGEIDAQLIRHPGIREGAVIAREDVPGDRRLVAYFVPEAAEQVSVEDVRAHLKALLPEHMIPSAFVMLEHLPATPNGKLDRRALPAPDAAAYVRRSYEAPVGAVEESVAGVWQALLHAERVGRRDNFFELGGHSLLIVQMMERLRRLGLSAEVRDVFESPTLADLAQTLQSEAMEQFEAPPNLISADCEVITPALLPLIDLSQAEIDRIVAAVPGGARNVQDIYPLAPLQEGILFHHLLKETGGDAYVLPRAFAIVNRDRLDDLIAAVQTIIDRHDVLRTAVRWEQLSRPVQVVYRRALLPVSEAPLDATRPVPEQIQEWMSPQRQRLDIRQAPLLRLQWAMDPSGDGRCYAMLQLHHMTIDHVALQIVTTEIVECMERREHSDSNLAAYRNHVAQSLAYARKHDANAFFRERLGDVDESTAPYGLLDVHGDGTQIEHARLKFEPELSLRIRGEARRQSVSAATLFHAAWALVVARTSGRDDVVFGSVLLGRLQVSSGARRTLGMFINTLPLRVRLQEVSARGLVEQTQRELVGLLNHEQASLADAQRCSGIEGTAPLFSALLNFRHSVPNPAGDWGSVQGLQVLAGQERTNYPITVSVDDLGEGFGLSVLTDERVSPRRVAAYLQTAVESLIDALARAPQLPALDLAVVPAAEQRELIESLNATAREYSGEQFVHRLFEQTAGHSPQAIAVSHGSEQLTYRELNERSNRLARWLQARGVVPGALVALCMERSIAMVVGVLGIVKAGAAYVPLDPNYPPERLQAMLEDAQPSLILTQRSLQLMVPDADMSVSLEDVAPQIAGYDADDLPLTSDGSDADPAIYVIFTSGSTGRPKGTVMGHRSMVNLLEWHRHEARLSEPRRTLQFAALSFDVAFQELFSTLCTGGTLVLLDEQVRKDARALLDLLVDESVERLFIPPLMLQSLAECFGTTPVDGLRLRDIITAGEQLIVSDEIVALCRQLPSCQLHNHYGPTETHVVTALTLAGEPAQWPALPTIGRPIANTQIYILDAQRRPTPFGVAGEIHIAGANVASGYLHRPELTAERFLRDPFSADPRARMYKTGDLGRWRADGSVEYVGRNDDQVKIRGYRVELGEIEAELRRHPDIREAAVVARDDGSTGKRLVAYITTGKSAEPGPDALRLHLKETLPEHMVPGAFVVLDSLPVTPSGKLNRRALPAPEVSAYGCNDYQAPEGEVEQALAAIWRAVLGVERIGRRDDFFELGGHSLLALKLLLRVNQQFGCTLRVTDIYKNAMLQELSARIGGVAAEDAFVDLGREARIDPNIVAAPGSVQVPPRALLLTGAAGFVGRFLLAQLLEDTEATVYCLLRAESRAHARTRLIATLSHWDLWRPEFDARIVALPGDLKLPRLGLDQHTFRMLAGTLDGIYHCATSMNHLETFAMARAANVDSVNDLLRLATDGRPKAIHYISTLGVFGATAEEPPRQVDEQTPLDHEKYRYSQGYLASKWVSEKMFLMAAERGVPCNVFRLGLVWADAERGRFDELQNVYRVLKSSLLSGYGIAGYRYPMPPTPVDHVARAIVFLGNRHAQGQGIFHIGATDQHVDGVFERCNDIASTSLQLLPHYEWIQQIKRLHLEGYSLPAVPLIEYAFSMNQDTFQRHQRSVRSAVHVRFSFEKTQRELEAAGIVTPMLNDSLLSGCIEGMLSRDAELREAHGRDATRRRAGGAMPH